MKIERDRVATIHYTLTDDDENVIDSSSGGDPMPYLHGAGNIIPGLETELEGRIAGDAFQVRLLPAVGYGERRDAMIQVVDRKQLPMEQLEVGMQLQAETEDGTLIVRVADIQGDEVTLDANHPLAGVTLNFDVTVVHVREATEEELQHGHVHGPGGHHD
ncbi:MAG: FKBP-type peptidyl-prolyl cis-trans isomerase [Planctomycetota bacterium]